jgi:Ni,Fe-hydrogenase III large subunit
MSRSPILSASALAAGHKAGRDGFVRITVSENQWTGLARGCNAGRQDLCSLWVDAPHVRMALMAQDGRGRLIASLRCKNGRYPSVGQYHAPAMRLERAMRDLYGVVAAGMPDDRPWLDHGTRPTRAGRAAAPKPYVFLPVDGEGLHQIPVGPVHAGIIEPGHFRFTANGETVVRLEQRLGYVHKGTEALCAGKDIDTAGRIIGRMSGDSTVAYAFAYARAVEAAVGIVVPERAILLRGVMAELERMAHHINDFGAICNDASAVAIHAHCVLLRERILQAADRCFGHRLMMDRIVAGGVTADLSEDGIADLRRLLDHCDVELRRPVRAYDGSPSIQDRTVTTGRISEPLVRRFAAGGFVGRSAGRSFDSRRDATYPPYDRVDFSVPVRNEGDVDARVWIRIEEFRQSLAILRQLLDQLRPGPIRARSRPAAAGEGAALVEAFRGDVLVAVRLGKNGRVLHCHSRDPSWFQWPLLEAAIEGNIVADFPLCNKSFNCSYSGHDM